MISLLILLLLFCFFCFFKVIRRLSEKIYAFSSFLDKSAEGNLKEYQLSSEEKFAEIDTLVRSYNDLVHKNRILNERMMHMEALTQEARYQACLLYTSFCQICGLTVCSVITGLCNTDQLIQSQFFHFLQICIPVVH